MKSKSTLRKIILINTATVCALLLVLEAMVRLFGPEIPDVGTDRSLIKDHAYGDSPGLQKNSSGYSHGALFEIGQYGFWRYASPVDMEKPSWLLLGDSVTMGIGVDPDSTFAGRLAAKLDTINVLNASLIGYSVDDYRRILPSLIERKESSEGHQFNIRRVSLFWCLNDIYPDISIDNDPGNRIRSIGGSTLRFVRKHFKSYRLLKAVIFDRPKSYFEYVNQFYGAGHESLDSSLQKIVQVAQLAKRAGVKFDIVILPYEYQLRGRLASRSLLPQKTLTSYLEYLSLAVLDPLEYLRNAGLSSNELYLYGDGIHFSSDGHALLAEFVATHLFQRTE